MSGPDLQDWLEAARADAPPPGALARQLARVGLEPPASLATTRPPTPPTSSLALATPSIATALATLTLVGAVLTGGVATRSRHGGAPPPPSSRHTRHAIVAPTLPLPPPVAPAASSISPSIGAPEPSPPAVHVERGEVRPRPPPTRGLAEEVALVTRARVLARANPREALGLATVHARDFRHGVLTDEMTLVRVEALVADGRIDEARAVGAPVARARPGTPLAARITELVGAP